MLYPSKVEDKGENIIRLDAPLRRNLNAIEDDIVEIRKIEASIAKVIFFSGIKDVVTLRKSQQLAKKLENRVITIGDILSFYSMGRRVDLVVVAHHPKEADVVRIRLDTKTVLLPITNIFLSNLDEEAYKYIFNLLHPEIGIYKSEPRKIIEFCESALKNSKDKQAGYMFFILARAFINLGGRTQDTTCFEAAEIYYKKAREFYENQLILIKRELKHLEDLKS